MFFKRYSLQNRQCTNLFFIRQIFLEAAREKEKKIREDQEGEKEHERKEEKHKRKMNEKEAAELM